MFCIDRHKTNFRFRIFRVCAVTNGLSPTPQASELPLRGYWLTDEGLNSVTQGKLTGRAAGNTETTQRHR